MPESVISKTTGDAGIIRLVEIFANMGAPWLSGFGDVQPLAEDLDLNLIENFPTAELHQACWSDRLTASPIYLYSGVHAGSRLTASRG